MPKKLKIKHVSRWQAYLLLLLNVALNAVALPLVKPIFGYTTPFRFLFYRFVIAVIISTPILYHFIRRHSISFKQILLVAAIELFGSSLSLGILYLGLARTTSLEANLIATSSPIFVVLAGVIYLREKEERHEWVGLLLAFLGTLLIIVLPILKGQTAFSMMSFTGNALILLQNITGALGLILAKKYYVKIPKFVVTGIASIVGMFSFAALSYWELGAQRIDFTRVILDDFQHFSLWSAVLYMSIGVTLIASTAYLKGQECIEASEASLFSYLSPLIFFPVSIFILHEGFNPLHVIGLTVVLVGVIVAEARVRKIAKVKPHKVLKHVKHLKTQNAFKLKENC